MSETMEEVEARLRKDPEYAVQRINNVLTGMSGRFSSQDLRKQGGFVSSSWAGVVWDLLEDCLLLLGAECSGQCKGNGYELNCPLHGHMAP